MILTHLVLFRFFAGAGGTAAPAAGSMGFWLWRMRRRIGDD